MSTGTFFINKPWILGALTQVDITKKIDVGPEVVQPEPKLVHPGPALVDPNISSFENGKDDCFNGLLE